jgi:hypothetical protein
VSTLLTLIFRAPLMAAAALALLAGPLADAVTVRKQNLTQLITESHCIISGRVERVTDGITESGMPYTEVTIAVSTAAKGDVRDGSSYTFRQFGLTKPRRLPDGKVLMGGTPAGFPQWASGERVVAFLYQPASRTGFQTTTGLAQGKLRMEDGRARNEFNNEGLFDGVRIQEGLLTEKERAMMTSEGAVDAATFIGLVGRAVNERWIETGGMR